MRKFGEIDENYLCYVYIYVRCMHGKRDARQIHAIDIKLETETETITHKIARCECIGDKEAHGLFTHI